MGDCLSQDEGRTKGSSISVLEFLATVFENIITALTEILVEHTEKTLTNVRVFYWPHNRRFFGEISFGFIQSIILKVSYSIFLPETVSVCCCLYSKKVEVTFGHIEHPAPSLT